MLAILESHYSFEGSSVVLFVSGIIIALIGILLIGKRNGPRLKLLGVFMVAIGIVLLRTGARIVVYVEEPAQKSTNE